ncbi:MAG: sulfite exporter TauE/SafE family protein [Magnetococcales bacterium]|nr:sulfite exporter TauE/SafE family protein [Magnetococcales bacterium]
MEVTVADLALLWIPLLMGITALPHCLGMCGAILGALTAALPTSVRDQSGRMLLYLLLYGAGRVTTYAILGGIAALPGLGLMQLGGAPVRFAMQATAALVLLVAGLHLGGWWNILVWLERKMMPLWHLLQPVTQRMLPTRAPWHALAFGLLWGCLPCGMVYAALLWSATGTSSPAASAASMALFGLGTLPFTLGGGLMSGKLLTLRPSLSARRLAAVILMVVGITALFWSGWRLLAPAVLPVTPDCQTHSAMTAQSGHLL